MNIEIKNNQLYFTRAGEVVRLSACGKNCIRFQGSPSGKIIEQDWTLMPRETEARAWAEDNKGVLETGNMRAEIYEDGIIAFFRNGKQILREKAELVYGGVRNYRNTASGLWKARITFEPNENEHFYGMGHDATGCFDLKGCTLDLRHVNAKCTIPYVYSSLGYGFLWNMPSLGSCELAANRTRWVSDSTRQVDYVVIGGSPKEATMTLADLTGHSPDMPHWATGFWQCRLRYESQEQVLEVARSYKELGIPLSVIVVDYFHWTEQGDYKFDPKYWENPRAMADELHSMGIKLMVSMWPTINEYSENYHEMLDKNMLMRTTRGSNCVFAFYGPQAQIDPTNEETRRFVWEKLKKNYIDIGVDCLWFDEAEPEINPVHIDNLVMSIGNGDEVGLLYPYYYSKLAYDGFKEMGREDILTLSRCAYTGSQKFATLVWSGDIKSTFKSLSEQVKTGLNMAMCAIPWWTTDIGGFDGGDIESDYFKELIVRWFQYGVFCPVTRLHGRRNKTKPPRDIIEPTGGDNELWSFGERNFEILKELVFLRERLRPYVEKHMRLASDTGIPVMRPMFFDYPDEEFYSLGEQYLFGDEIIFAPVTGEGQTKKKVYLPDGEWILTMDKKEYTKGWHEIDVPIDKFAAFVKKGAEVLSVF